jgi:hypothetical protein
MSARNTLAGIVAAALAAGTWMATGSTVATGFTSSASGSLSVSSAYWLNSKADCYKDGWLRSTNPKFKNQGDCVSHFSADKDPGGKGNGPKSLAAPADAQTSQPAEPTPTDAQPSPKTPATDAQSSQSPEPAAAAEQPAPTPAP